MTIDSPMDTDVQSEDDEPVARLREESTSEIIPQHLVDINDEVALVTNRDISWWRMIAYGVGHFYNDLCASMWFTYLMIYLQNVLNFSATLAGTLMLIGQVTDAICTPCIGIASDGSFIPYCLRRMGRRMSWHLIGVICVTVSFPFVFNNCLFCTTNTAEWLMFFWHVPFIVLFQFGWASVQVSHLALIPELSQSNHCRSSMSSLRFGSTVVANLTVFGVLTVMLRSTDQGGGISPQDITHFSMASLVIVGVGVFVTIIFYVVIREPSTGRRLSRLNSEHSTASGPFRMSWMSWLRTAQFYQIALLYTMSRLFINVSQVYFPFYITITQGFSKKFVAIFPLVSYVSSFAISTLLGVPVINKKLNQKAVYSVGCFAGFVTCACMMFSLRLDALFAVAALLGIAQSIILISSLSFTAELINENTESGAFVYGAMSFMDKLTNGVFYQVIQVLSPQGCGGTVTPMKCGQFYKTVMTSVPGSCLFVALIIVIFLMTQRIGYRARRHRHVLQEEENDGVIPGSDERTDGDEAIA
ncbi:hypothetical protein AB6A40_002414 [Gnathostoma spinigerum]|uniref:Uncharacterized protein n=1 Tax=Gnathostoma spinigerum TaxID=75299 RepID=A0ABD6EHB4_9BILA